MVAGREWSGRREGNEWICVAEQRKEGQEQRTLGSTEERVEMVLVCRSRTCWSVAADRIKVVEEATWTVVL